MAFIDELNIHLSAGRGGNGVVRWLHEKGKESGGPSGGNGGKGGDVYALAVRDIGALGRYRAVKTLEAGCGKDGEGFGRQGKSGEPLFLELPVGSVIYNSSTRRRVELLREGDQTLLLQGGRGGLGNKYFKSSTNTKPSEWTLGEKGEDADFAIEINLIADAGLIGLPNAGKSSLLNVLTNASAKVGSYAFTTLEPNLGDFYGFILADIPGLIEGASGGKGLGHKFLRHIKRTKLIAHLVSLENKNIKEAYQTIRLELHAYDQSLLDKPEIIILTKTDLVSKEALEKAKNTLSVFFPAKIFALSILDDKSVKSFADNLTKILRGD